MIQELKENIKRAITETELHLSSGRYEGQQDHHLLHHIIRTDPCGQNKQKTKKHNFPKRFLRGKTEFSLVNNIVLRRL